MWNVCFAPCGDAGSTTACSFASMDDSKSGSTSTGRSSTFQRVTILTTRLRKPTRSLLRRYQRDGDSSRIPSRTAGVWLNDGKHKRLRNTHKPAHSRNTTFGSRVFRARFPGRRVQCEWTPPRWVTQSALHHRHESPPSRGDRHVAHAAPRAKRWPSFLREAVSSNR